MNKQDDLEYSGQVRDVVLTELIAQVQDENTKNYITACIMPQMMWYSQRSKKYKQQYYRWMTFSILMGGLIPIVSVFANGMIWVKILIAALGTAVTTSNAYISLHNYKDLWLNYQNTHEILLRVLYCYFYSVSIFTRCGTQAEKDTLLVNICENVLYNESNGWQILMKDP